MTLHTLDQGHADSRKIVFTGLTACGLASGLTLKAQDPERLGFNLKHTHRF
ncbi:hypothetical protein P775_18265 [Puniceibacterium antarcticum]|uniref:Uncharacterized protein n=1 Tax=Puniceibacterium antarcticum TaxID=1206336 RepID=A0A2G8RAF5_9RHOB|nr:hypothetical protein P775_18265 [Puniceibacterium antarcticum]